MEAGSVPLCACELQQLPVWHSNCSPKALPGAGAGDRGTELAQSRQPMCQEGWVGPEWSPEEATGSRAAASPSPPAPCVGAGSRHRSCLTLGEENAQLPDVPARLQNRLSKCESITISL